MSSIPADTATVPLISIVVAVLNDVESLPRCLDSIAVQSFPGREVLVADGASTDGTVALVEERAAEGQITWHDSTSDSGLYAAWNRALPHARGEWICFLGADDFLWSPDSLAHLAPTLEAAPASLRVVYGTAVLVDADGDELYRLGKPWPEVQRRFRGVMCVPHPGLMHRRALFTERGGFDESLRVAADYELLLRELRTGDASFVDVVVAGVSAGGVSTDPRGTLRALREVRRAQRKNGIAAPRPAWLIAYARASARLLLWAVAGERAGRRLTDLARKLAGIPAYWTRT